MEFVSYKIYLLVIYIKKFIRNKKKEVCQQLKKEKEKEKANFSSKLKFYFFFFFTGTILLAMFSFIPCLLVEFTTYRLNVHTHNSHRDYTAATEAGPHRRPEKSDGSKISAE